MMLSPYFWLTLLAIIAIVGCVRMFYLLKGEADTDSRSATNLTKGMIVVLTFTLLALGLCRISSKGQEVVTVKQVYPVIAGGGLILIIMSGLLYSKTSKMTTMIKTIAKVIPACAVMMTVLVGWEIWTGDTPNAAEFPTTSPVAASLVSDSPSPFQLTPSSEDERATSPVLN